LDLRKELETSSYNYRFIARINWVPLYHETSRSQFAERGVVRSGVIVGRDEYIELVTVGCQQAAFLSSEAERRSINTGGTKTACYEILHRIGLSGQDRVTDSCDHDISFQYYLL
jgi:hypothetical protein